MNGKNLHFFCSESTAFLRKYITDRHYSLEHKKKYKTCVNALRKEEVTALKMGHESQKNTFRKHSNDSFSAVWANYHVHACWLMKQNIFLMNW